MILARPDDRTGPDTNLLLKPDGTTRRPSRKPVRTAHDARDQA
jgi:hypothetical protein